jgi:hypothetical protein
MAIGVYGVKRPADVDPNDIEVVVIYTKTRNAGESQIITKLFGNQVIKPVMSTPEFGGKDVEILGGLYNMTLPKTVFNIH